jgi:hypothetical protein
MLLLLLPLRITACRAAAAHESYTAAAEIGARPIEIIRMMSAARTECPDMATVYLYGVHGRFLHTAAAGSKRPLH